MGQLPSLKPVRQVEQDSRKVSGFSHPEQKPHHVQVGGSLHEASQHCHDSPANQYPRNPDPRSDLVHQKIAGYLKNEITPKEYSRQESELLACDSQVLVHRQRREANIDPVEEGDHHENEDKWDDPSLKLAEDRKSTRLNSS